MTSDKPFNPFERGPPRELTAEDVKLLSSPPAPLKVLIPVVIEPDEHQCHAKGCTKFVKPEMLMCFKHWRKVPRKLQLAVWKHYRPGQCDDKDVTRAWLNAADAAINYVAKLEKK